VVIGQYRVTLPGADELVLLVPDTEQSRIHLRDGLARAIAKRGWSAWKVSREMGVNIQTAKAVMSGDRVPHWGTLFAMTRSIGWKWDYDDAAAADWCQ
jgi:hypothetical protein